ncbi:MAG TPA: hypothetical protein VE172_23000 [Stackebrandtia sp.]|uniref:hypothetical protein n=1 Tax=Stackebrandtia sp. TaxID=2023065 RepID=UPI002D5A05AE|nr:hypothetical protein [Stackebrandtia sp.]HZE41677.1 hypothetical protein [Stackebrandtia sp.]
MGLSRADIAEVAETLRGGKHPRVVFTAQAGQISGKVGKVVRLTEPAEDDFVVVAFGNDELPFTAEEVRMPQRGELTRKTTKKPDKKTATPPAPTGAPLLGSGDNKPAAPARSRKENTVTEDVAAVPHQAEAPADAAAPAASAPRKRAAKAKAAPELTVTLAWTSNEWTVAASKGTKVIAKPVPVKASVAVDMVKSLQSPAVAAVVEDIVEQQRSAAASEAERLRQELADAEARLAELG